MGKFFALDSPVMRFLSRLADLMILNLLVLITCIPIITVGASLSALHYVLIKMVRDEETYITKMYFKSFKENFAQGTILWLIVLLVAAVFVGDYFVFIRAGKEFSIVFVVAVFAVGVLFLMTSMYIFPLQARFYNTVGHTLKNAFLVMILNFPKSICMLLLYLVPVVLLLVSPMATPFLIMFGISAPSLGAVYLYRKVFSRFEPETDGITPDMEFQVNMEGVETEGEEQDKMPEETPDETLNNEPDEMHNEETDETV
ncbi:MAG: YesL family protein [Lachnospiraceae bacterium]|nr:YesL family protein [Lachnospiraceae bacterium]